MNKKGVRNLFPYVSNGGPRSVGAVGAHGVCPLSFPRKRESSQPRPGGSHRVPVFFRDEVDDRSFCLLPSSFCLYPDPYILYPSFIPPPIHDIKHPHGGFLS